MDVTLVDMHCWNKVLPNPCVFTSYAIDLSNYSYMMIGLTVLWQLIFFFLFPFEEEQFLLIKNGRKNWKNNNKTRLTGDDEDSICLTTCNEFTMTFTCGHFDEEITFAYHNFFSFWCTWNHIWFADSDFSDGWPSFLFSPYETQVKLSSIQGCIPVHHPEVTLSIEVYHNVRNWVKVFYLLCFLAEANK